MPIPDKSQLPFAKSNAFLIAINDYQHLTPLETPVADVTYLAKKLEQDHGYLVHPPLLNPTLEQMRDWLHTYIPTQIQPITEGGYKDRLLFYFAGHGIAFESDFGPQGYLIPADAQREGKEFLIHMDELYQVFSDLPCDHGLLILDCCFAGSFRWAQKSRSLVLNELPHIIYEERFRRYCLDPAWQVLCSSAHDQKALDILDNYSLGYRSEQGNFKHSPFALALFEALDGKADCIPTEGGDGLITASELYLYLRDQVESKTIYLNHLRQTPLLFPLPRHDKGEYIFLSPSHRLNLPPTPRQNPFKGLNSFEETDVSLFFGRDQIIEKLTQHILTYSLTVLTGASGTGKSSLIKAGTLPKMRMQGYHIFPIIRPGKTPIEGFYQKISDLANYLNDSGGLIIVDQFEELLTQTEDPQQAIEFQIHLLRLLEKYPGLKIILSVRSDFEPQFEQGPLKSLWQLGRFPITPFSPTELRQVIVQPALQEVFDYEPSSLIDTIIDEISQAPGGLPLLSFTLSELYHAYIESGRRDRLFTLADYQKLGGVIGSLRTKADKVYQNLGKAEKNTMRRLMLRMVSLKGGETAGKRAYLEELQFQEGEENQRVQTVLDRLVEARLIIRDQDQQAQSFVEPAHDALVRAWATLWEWIKTTGEERIILQNKLNQAVGDYEQSADERNLLWNNDPRLGLLERELLIEDSWMNARERDFVRASLKRRSTLRRRNYGILMAVIAGLAILAGIAVFQANLATRRSRLLARQVEISDSTAIVADSNASRAERAVVRANEKTTEANKNLVDALKFQINVLEGNIGEEQQKALLAKEAGLGAVADHHQREIQVLEERINSLQSQITRIQEEGLLPRKE